MLFEHDVKNNAAEYVLYLWQMEDLLRALQFDMGKLQSMLEEGQVGEVEMRRELNRFQILIGEMHDEEILQKGHLARSLHLIAELFVIHRKLLTDSKEAKYSELYQKALPNLNDFIAKSGNQKLNEIEACFNALYGLFLLRLKKQPVSKITEQAMGTFSNLLAYLAEKHKTFKVNLN